MRMDNWDYCCHLNVHLFYRLLVITMSIGQLRGQGGLNEMCTSNADCNRHHECIGSLCKSKPNSPCRGDYDCALSSQRACEEGVCKILHEKRCDNSNATNQCQANNICDLNICKKKADTPCTVGACASTLECDSQISLCKVRLLQACTNTSQCAYTDTRECHGNQCKSLAGGGCTSDADCVSQHECTDVPTPPFTCKSPIGFACTASSGCTTNHCAPISGICKINVNGNCTSRDMCTTGAICEAGVCKMEFGGACRVDSNCVNGTKCDATVCRYSLNSPCAVGVNSSCSAGMACDNALLQTPVCKMKPMSRCRTHRDCLHTAECELDICRTSVNQPCLKGQCIIKAVCVQATHVCKVRVREGCNHDNECVMDGVCENGICKLQLNDTCVLLMNQCAQGMGCDKILLKCRLYLHQPCTPGLVQCWASMKCDTDSHKCRQKPMGSCQTEDECLTGSVCEQNLCRSSIFRPCSVEIEDCTQLLVCDPDTLTCRRDINDVCAAGECVSRATCEDSVACKVKINERCIRQDQCVKNSVCDRASCKLVADATCHDASECRDGHTCDTNRHACRYSLDNACNVEEDKCEYNTVCDPAAKKCKLLAGAPCNKSNSRLCTTGAVCNEEKCLCDGIRYFRSEHICGKATLVEVPWTSNITLFCEYTLTREMQDIQWIKDNNPFEREADFTGGHIQNPNLTLFNVSGLDSGIYFCRISSVTEEANTSFVRLSVKGCFAGLYGEECTEECGECFDEKPCDDETGYCLACANDKAFPLCKENETMSLRSIIILSLLGFIGLIICCLATMRVMSDLNLSIPVCKLANCFMNKPCQLKRVRPKTCISISPVPSNQSSPAGSSGGSDERSSSGNESSSEATYESIALK